MTTTNTYFLIPQPALETKAFQQWMLEDIIQNWLYCFEHNELPNTYTPWNKPGFVSGRFDKTYSRCTLTLFDGTEQSKPRGIQFTPAQRPYPKDLTTIAESFEAFLKYYSIHYSKT